MIFFQKLEAKFIWSQDLFGNSFVAKAGKAFLLPHWKRFWRSWNFRPLCMLMRWQIFCSAVDLRLLRRVRSGELSRAVASLGRCLRYTRRSRTKKGAKSSFVLLIYIQLSRDFMLMKGALHHHHTSNIWVALKLYLFNLQPLNRESYPAPVWQVTAERFCTILSI